MSVIARIVKPTACKSAQRAFAARTRTLDQDFEVLHPVLHRLAAGIVRRHLRGVGRRFTASP